MCKNMNTNSERFMSLVMHLSICNINIPPRAYQGHLTPSPSPGVGNLTLEPLGGVGNLTVRTRRAKRKC